MEVENFSYEIFMNSKRDVVVVAVCCYSFIHPITMSELEKLLALLLLQLEIKSSSSERQLNFPPLAVKQSHTETFT